MEQKKDVITCISCGTSYRRPANLPPTGAEVKCKKCGTMFVVVGDEEGFLAGATIRIPGGASFRVASSTDVIYKIRSGEIPESAEVSRDGTEWYPLSTFTTLRDAFAARPKRPTLITPESESREPKSTVLISEESVKPKSDQIVTATTPPREMTTIDRRAAPQAEFKPAPEKPSDSLLDAIGAKPQEERPEPKAMPKAEVKKEEDDEFNKLFEDEDEAPRKPFKVNIKIVAAVAGIVGIAILILLLVKTGGEPKATAERKEIPTEQPTAPEPKQEPTPTPTPAPAPAPTTMQQPTAEPPKSDLVKEQEELMRRQPQQATTKKEPPRKASVPATPLRQTEAPKKGGGGSVKALVDRGWKLTDKGDNDGAIDLFLKAIELDPANGQAYYGLGYAYQAKGQKAKAREYYQKALNARISAADRADIENILNNL